MTKRRTIDLVRSLAREEAAVRGQEFLAPLLRGGRARMRIQGLIYEFIVTDAQPGWWICQARDARHADVVGEAAIWQRGDYLALWPEIRLVLVEQLHDHAWLALPYQLDDGTRLLNQAGPVTIMLTEGGQRFDRIIGRVEGSTIWYDEHDRRADPATAEQLRAALAEVRENPGVRSLSDGEKAAFHLISMRQDHNHTRSQERTARSALAIGGAQLVGFQRDMDRTGFLVTWERDGVRSVTHIDARLNVISSGICLSGRDGDFDLASIVGVVYDSPWHTYRRNRGR
jgi:hypothetical protein